MTQTYQRILVPVDGSAQAELALQKAAAVAKRNHAHVDILSVLDMGHYGFNADAMISGDVVNDLVANTQSYLNDAIVRTKRESDYDDIDIHIRFGSPKAVISREFPEDHHCDLIMMGATGMNAVAQVLEGSVTAFVTRRAKIDVLVVRTDLNNQLVDVTQFTEQNTAHRE